MRRPIVIRLVPVVLTLVVSAALALIPASPVTADGAPLGPVVVSTSVDLQPAPVQHGGGGATCAAPAASGGGSADPCRDGARAPIIDCGGQYDTWWVFDAHHPEEVKTFGDTNGLLNYEWGPDEYYPDEGRWRLTATRAHSELPTAFLFTIAWDESYLDWYVGYPSWWKPQEAGPTLDWSLIAADTPTVAVAMCRGEGSRFSLDTIAEWQSVDMPWKEVSLEHRPIILSFG